jgi:hypothetical protein
MRLLFLAALLLWSAIRGPVLNAQDIPLTAKSTIRIADVTQARDILQRRDLFIDALSPFDRQCRVGSAEDVSEDELLDFLAEQAIPWTEEEMARIRAAVSSIQRRLGTLEPPWPEVIHLIKTTGKEESGAAYCRPAAVILPQQILDGRNDEQLERLLVHELFHVLSRHDAELRRKLYAIIGFDTCAPIPVPETLADRKITNPDGPLLDSVIRLKTDDDTLYATPILFALRDYDPQREKSLFRYLQFRLLVVAQSPQGWQAVVDDGGEPQLLEPRSTRSFLEQLGENTNYIIHPDEVLADNFVHLLMDTPMLPTPRIVARMREALPIRAE